MATLSDLGYPEYLGPLIGYTMYHLRHRHKTLKRPLTEDEILALMQEKPEWHGISESMMRKAIMLARINFDATDLARTMAESVWRGRLKIQEGGQ